MANSVTTQVLANTDRKLVIQRVLFSDGTEEDQAVMVDISASAYNHSDGTALSGVAVERIYGSISSTATVTHVTLGWAATVIYPFAHLGHSTGVNSAFDLDYGSEWGGITKNSITQDAGTEAGNGSPTGDIAVTTGTLDDGESYVITLVMRKIF